MSGLSPGARERICAQARERQARPGEEATARLAALLARITLRKARENAEAATDITSRRRVS